MNSRANVILICGEDEYFVRRKARELAAEMTPVENREFGREVVEGEAGNVAEAVAVLRRTLEALQTRGFFGDEKLVWLKDADFLGTTRIGESKSLKHALDGLNAWISESAGQGNRLLLNALGVGRQTALYKRSKKFGTVFDFAVGSRAFEQRAYAEERLREKAAELGLRMTGSVRAAFLDRVGNETRKIFSELDKLKTYLGDATKVTPEAIREIVSAGEVDAIWDFVDAMGRRDPRASLAILRRLLDQQFPPIALCANLESRLREWRIFREALDRKWIRLSKSGQRSWVDWNPIPEEVQATLAALPRDPRKMAPFRAARCAACALNYSPAELRKACRRITELREALVSTAADPETLLEIALMRIVPPSRTSPRRNPRNPSC